MVFWTDTAIGHLDTIFDFYKTRAGNNVKRQLNLEQYQLQFMNFSKSGICCK